jgi:hypothetical protein
MRDRDKKVSRSLIEREHPLVGEKVYDCTSFLSREAVRSILCGVLAEHIDQLRSEIRQSVREAVRLDEKK